MEKSFKFERFFHWLARVYDRDLPNNVELAKSEDGTPNNSSPASNGKTNTFYQVLIDSRDCPYIRAQTEAVTFLGNQESNRSLYAIPGLDYVSHDDILPYASGEKTPLQHELFDKFLCHSADRNPPYTAHDTLRAWQKKNHPWLELSDVHRETSEDIRDTVYQISSSDVDYVNEAKAIIYGHENITTQNALSINQNLQEYLKELKRKLETLLQQCRDKYKANEIMLDKIVNQPPSAKKDLRSTSYFFCGKPYFKQMNLFSTPHNADYLYRKTTMNEYFPIDHFDFFRLWSAKDKLFLVNGVKEQLLKFLSSQQRDVARKVKSGTRQAVRQRKSILGDRSLEGKKLCELFELIKNTDFQIDWFTIATKHLDDRHTVNECIGIWNTNLKPSLNRQPWTDEDDEKLIRVAEEFNCQKWETIGLKLNNRSGYDCIMRYQGIINDQSMLKNCRWTKEEDQLLVDTVESCRIGSFIPWTKVVDKMPLRSKMQVYHRYMFTLKPDIKKEKFTIEEDCIITAAVKEYGPTFNKFSMKLLPGRTLAQIRHRYTNVLKHVNSFKEWTYEDDLKLIELTNEMGTSDWASISKQLIHHTRLSCRSRYMTITKFLQKYPNSEIKDVTRRARKQSTNVKEDNWMQEIINYKKKVHDQSMEDRRPGPNTLVGVDFHEFFKYSYKFELKQLCEADEPASDKCRAISYVLHNSVYPKDHKLLYGPTDCRIDMASMTNCEVVDVDYLIPPNLNTALILRGLAIMYPNVDKDCEQCRNDTEALQLLKKRISFLLYSTAVASYVNFPGFSKPTSKGNKSGVATTSNIQGKRRKI